jgi:hypothetical protein
LIDNGDDPNKRKSCRLVLEGEYTSTELSNGTADGLILGKAKKDVVNV